MTMTIVLLLPSRISPAYYIGIFAMSRWLALSALLALLGCKTTECCPVAYDPCATQQTIAAPAAPVTPQVDVQQANEIHVQAKPQKVLVKRQAAEVDPHLETAQMRRLAQQAQSRVMLVPSTSYTPYVVAQTNQLGPMIMQGAAANQLIEQSGQRLVQRGRQLTAEEADEIQIDASALMKARQPSNETVTAMAKVQELMDEQTKTMKRMAEIMVEQNKKIGTFEDYMKSNPGKKADNPSTNPTKVPTGGPVSPTALYRDPGIPSLPFSAQSENTPLPGSVVIPNAGK